jgi:hypothetical protein
MPTSAKPKHPYKPRPIVKPLKARNDWIMEGEIHTALLAIKHDQVAEEHLTRLASHADLVRRLETAPWHAQRQAQTIIRILYQIMQRSKTNGITVTALEETALRAALQITLPASRQANNHAIERAARASLVDFDRNGGLKIDLNP